MHAQADGGQRSGVLKVLGIRFGARQHGVFSGIVHIAEVGNGLSLGRDRQRADRHVDLTDRYGRGQAVERKVIQVDLDAQLLADRLNQSDVKAVEFELSL